MSLRWYRIPVIVENNSLKGTQNLIRVVGDLSIYCINNNEAVKTSSKI